MSRSNKRKKGSKKNISNIKVSSDLVYLKFAKKMLKEKNISLEKKVLKINNLKENFP